MRRCTCCILPEHYPGIQFDETGICNYCRTHQRWEYLGDEALREFLEPFRNKASKYDCVMGISGGRDSSYMLYYLTRVCHLRVLAYTVDNGFYTETAKQNIRRMTDILRVDLVVEQNGYLKRCVRDNISAWLRRPSAAMVPMICCGCRLGVARLFRCTKQHGVSLLALSMKTPVETGLLKQALLVDNLLAGRLTKRKGLAQLVGVAYEATRNPYYWKPYSTGVYLAEYFAFFGFGAAQKLLCPSQKTLELFRYVEWNEDRILATIRSELGWKSPDGVLSTWRFDCRLSFLKNYFLAATIGITEKEDCLSAMIREGMISREAALERLESERAIPLELVRGVLEEIGLSGVESRLPRVD